MRTSWQSTFFDSRRRLHTTCSQSDCVRTCREAWSRNYEKWNQTSVHNTASVQSVEESPSSALQRATARYNVVEVDSADLRALAMLRLEFIPTRHVTRRWVAETGCAWRYIICHMGFPLTCTYLLSCRTAAVIHTTQCIQDALAATASAEGRLDVLSPMPRRALPTRTCDECRARKRKCVLPPTAQGTSSRCNACCDSSLRCTFDLLYKKRGPQAKP